MCMIGGRRKLYIIDESNWNLEISIAKYTDLVKIDYCNLKAVSIQFKQQEFKSTVRSGDP
jgi:hypothetical protein